jgi:hypothetical protein
MRGRRWLIDADSRGFFDALDPAILEQLLCERICDRRLLKLRSWLKAGLLEGETLQRPELGSPQGSPISPLVANVYLNALDRAWEEGHGELGVLVSYADDLVLWCRTRAQAEAALRELRAQLAELRLALADAKTRLLFLDEDGEGSFDFLGLPPPDAGELQQAGLAFPGPLAVGSRHAGGQAEDPRAHRSAALRAAGRGRRNQPQPVADRLGRLLPPGQLHDPVPQTRPVHGRAVGALDRDPSQGTTATRVRLLAVTPGTLLRPATARRTSPPRCRACDQVKDVAAPCEGKPHARGEAAAGGNQRQSATPRGLGASRRPYHGFRRHSRRVPCLGGELVVERQAGGEGEEALEEALLESLQVRAPWRSRVRSSLQVEKIDSMRCRIGAR